MTRRGESQVEIALLALLLAEFYPEIDATSGLIGEAAGCNPVVVRRIYGKLKRAGLLDAGPGRRGLRLARDPRDITLLEVVEAVRPLDAASVFGVVRPLSGTCSISEELFGELRCVLDPSLEQMRAQIGEVSLHEFAWRLPDRYDMPLKQKLDEIHEGLREAEKRHSRHASKG